MDNLYWLDQIKRQERDFVGHQAFNLSQLMMRGYPVLPGFVVPARTFWQLVKIVGESEPLLADLPQSSFHVDVDNPRQLRAVAQRLRQAVVAAEFPLEWATSLAAAAEILPKSSAVILRPSLSLLSPTPKNSSYRLEKRQAVFNIQEYPHSLGILDYQICTATPEAMILALKRVWAELFRAKSLFYWQRAGVGLEELNLAVVVQPLEEAIASGTIQANSLTLDIQATWGLGSAITKGEVFGDSYQVQAATGIVKTRNLGRKSLAYRLKSFDDVADETSLIEAEQTTGSKSALQSYLLSEEQQKLYALEDPYIKQLIQISGRISTEIGSTFLLEWSLCQTPRSLEPEIYLTYFMPEILPSKPLTNSSLTSTALKGLPAAGGRVMAVAQVMSGESRNLETMLPGRILVASSIAPDWLPLLKQAAGIVTERGGMTSHGAIVARELGIPAVVNVADVTKLIQTGESLVVDGDKGEIHRLGSREGAGEMKVMDSSREVNQARSRQPSFYPIATQLLVNLSQVSTLDKVVGLPVDGVGLLRSELMMLEALESRHPNQWLQQGAEDELVERLAYSIVQIAAAFAPRPVLYRSLDWRSHEFASLFDDSAEVEVNPMLGRRGTLRYLSDPTYFDLELRR